MTPATLPARDEDLDPRRWLDGHGDYLYRYAKARVRRPDVAEDLVQETLLAAWRGRAKFRGRAVERSWLTSILKHKVIDWLRQAVREQARLTPLDPADPFFTPAGKWKHRPAAWAAGDSDLERAEFWAVVGRCTDKLPARLRDAFVLWHLEERPTEAVCQALKVTPTNMWVMLHRARLRLWKCLSTNWYGPDPAEREGRDEA